ncbi:TonB-dependent receptor [Solimonas terrae]|uniref:TonB-dependent receptor n=1 Tax=Solimonas terrae TaxID=1396819 RepID=A0A6M2BNA2_9GAMM|nr:TonB-dependent receptor [Solimonas terrae]
MRGCLLGAVFVVTHAGAQSATQTASDAAPDAESLKTIALPAEPPKPVVGSSGDRTPAPQIEEIIVTAQKKSESIQNTPISMTAFNEKMLQERGIDSVEKLQGNVPGISIEPFPTSNSTLRLFIRGVGLADAQVTQDPAVGVYLDGVYIARSSGLALEVADLERIEVLKGPQGTLYGRNTTGGAINLITKRPDPSGFWVEFTSSGGERALASGKATINAPLSADAAVKLGVLAKRQDGYVENTGPGGDFGDRKALGLRFDASWTPYDWLRADYGFDLTRVDAYAQMPQDVLPPDSDKGSANLIKEYAALNSVYSPHRLDHLATGMPMEQSTTRIDGHALTLTMPFEGYELKYIGAYRSLDDNYYADLGGGAGSLDFRLDSNYYDGPAATVAYGGPTPLVIPELKQHQWSHELQFKGKLFDEQFEYILGGFLFSERATDRTPFSHQASSALLPAQAAALYQLIPGLVNPLISLAGPRIVTFNMRDYGADNHAAALFGQGTWTPSWFDERLHLTLGYRHSQDSREAIKTYTQDNYLEVNVNGLGTAFLADSADAFDHVRGKRSYSNDSLSFISAFDLRPDVHLYAKYVEGYRSGGFNLRDPQISAASGPASDGTDYGFGFEEGFAPEYVASTEVGIKSDWFDRRFRINADVFYTDFKDMQITFLIPGTLGDTKATNAGHARIQGVELELAWAVTSWLNLSGDYSYLDAKVLKVIDATGANVADQYPFPSAPRHSGVLAADYTFFRGRWGQLRGSTNYSYMGERDGGGLPGRSDLSYLPAYGLVNTRLAVSGITLGHGELEVAAFARNLLDKDYITEAIPTLPQTDRAVFWGEPRTIGMELSYVWQ